MGDCRKPPGNLSYSVMENQNLITFDKFHEFFVRILTKYNNLKFYPTRRLPILEHLCDSY